MKTVKEIRPVCVGYTDHLDGIEIDYEETTAKRTYFKTVVIPCTMFNAVKLAMNTCK
jgi:hypothetical protein